MSIEHEPVLSDFPKLRCPLLRQTFAVEKLNGTNWYYTDKIEILGYDKSVAVEAEDRFD